MLIGLATLITIVFFGGSDSPFIIPKADKAIISAIEDKDRQKEVKELTKEFMKEWKQRNKENKKSSKELGVLIKDRTVSSRILDAKLEATSAEITANNEKLVDLRVEIEQIVTQQEWDNALQEVQKPKKVKSQTKAELKTRISQTKQVSDLRNNTLPSITDQPAREKAAEAINSFEDRLADMIFQSQGTLGSLDDVIYNRNSTAEELKSAYAERESLRLRSAESFIDLREVLIEVSDEDSWSDISKALLKFVN